MTRRELLQWATLAGLPASRATGVEREYTRQYRAKATVLLLGVPLLHRENVGSGYLRVAEREVAGKRQWRLEFGAGSLPERAAGLDRLGLFEETILEGGAGVESAQYFGFMTASNERDLGEAKRALQNGEATTYTAIRGQIGRGRLENRLLKIRDLPASGWANRERLKQVIQARLADETNREAELLTAVMAEEPWSPFLNAMRCAMEGREAEQTCRFVHNGKPHRLRTTKKKLEAAGQMEMEGQIHDGGGKQLSQFKVWFEENGVERGPVRFEFRPRTFLRLSFERV